MANVVLKVSFSVRCSMARYKRAKPQKPGDDYRRIWRIIDGCISDTFIHHPDYLPQGRSKISSLRTSLLKRIAGAILASAERSAKRRSGRPSAAKSASIGTTTIEANRGTRTPVAAVNRRRGAGAADTDPAPYDWMTDFVGSYDLAIAAMRREGLIGGRFEPQDHAEWLQTLRS